jgi:hypothetical protein
MAAQVFEASFGGLTGAATPLLLARAAGPSCKFLETRLISLPYAHEATRL